ncbi:MAG: hypothetical protein COW30_09160 [Rhodospirillales bacterium CG15_BIG_FIL_POST_REV_8_21_14_020_66_15]|nr:MAG: hypothetical protein COW30_09160 [Rhodospirillales bacterium CG15_BIG_FIL_POST_REV_8_21_14_020_66_15]
MDDTYSDTDFVSPPVLDQTRLEQLSEANREHVGELDAELHRLWGLGRNIILAWTPAGKGVRVLVIPHYILGEMAARTKGESPDSLQFVDEVIAGHTLTDEEGFDTIAKYFGYEPRLIELGFTPCIDLRADLVEAVVRRYSISYIRNGAVALFDIVGFSLYSPLEQVTQLNSLAYSVNASFSKMLAKDLDIQFARSTTGDGFYIWNRDRSIESNVNLYHLMHLVLADNAIARSKGKANTTPRLRSCFHVGPHYEFFQSEGLSPTVYSYIVGDVTIELARMIDQALPGQILVGDFHVDMREADTGEIKPIGTPEFIERTRQSLSNLEGMVLSGENVESIQCYLTGDRLDSGKFGIKRYILRDKHGLRRKVYNAKVNIYRSGGSPIYLGFQSNDLNGFVYESEEYV